MALHFEQCRATGCGTPKELRHAVASGRPPLFKSGYTPQLPFATEDCAVWDVPKAPAFVKDVTISDIPTLVINGTFDGKTSPMWATYVAKTLRNSTTIIIPGIGHL